MINSNTSPSIRLLTLHPHGLLRADALQCTTSGRLRVCCWRAAQNQDCLFADAYRAATVRERWRRPWRRKAVRRSRTFLIPGATVRESVPPRLFQQPAKVPIALRRLLACVRTMLASCASHTQPARSIRIKTFRVTSATSGAMNRDIQAAPSTRWLNPTAISGSERPMAWFASTA